MLNGVVLFIGVGECSQDTLYKFTVYLVSHKPVNAE